MKLLVLILLLLPAIVSADSCGIVAGKVEKQAAEVKELEDRHAEMSKSYDSHLGDDFAKQPSGLVDKLQRNEALKVIYARNKLEQSITSKKTALGAAKKELCGKCPRAAGCARAAASPPGP